MTLSGTQFLQWPPQGATSGVPLLSTTTTSAPLRPHPTRRPRACLSAAWAVDQAPRSRRRVRQPHSWHLASGYGTLIEGEEVKVFEKYPDFRKKEGGYNTLVEEKESPDFDKIDCATKETVKEDKLSRTKENLKLFELKYQQNQKRTTREVVGGSVCELSSAIGGAASADPSGGTVADSAALLEPRARRLNTGNTLPQPHGPRQINTSTSTANFITNMPGIKNLITRRRDPPLKRRDSCSLARLDAASTEHLPTTLPSSSRTGVRKCETVLALTGLEGVLRATIGPSRSGTNLPIPASAPVPLAPVNRLRTSGGVTTATCSRCSSLLSLQAATGSRYSLNSAGFISVCGSTDNLPPPVLCKLCLAEVPAKETFPIQQCNCSFCKDCMRAYVEFEIAEGAYDISCPDAQCPSQGVLQMSELEKLVSSAQLEKHKKYRLNREVDLDKTLTWCPKAGCETVCNVCPTGERCSPQPVHCPTCISDFCSNCKKPWHAGFTCEENSKRLAKEGKNEDAGIPFDSDLIKCCPMCNVPIEKDEGCAQMMCKRCKHVFCWYCLASLDDDFLLRHYDKGPCKNKLGHSRASVIWHRTQVIGIFAGFGILLLVASPLLLLAAPCIVCCKCRVCNAGTKLENEEEIAEESAT